MSNKEIIIEAERKTGIKHILRATDYERFTKERMIEHLSYWILFNKLADHTEKSDHLRHKEFSKFWEELTEVHDRKLLSFYEIDIDSYEFKYPNENSSGIGLKSRKRNKKL